jgi:carbonic anhydrase/acetyltransferase-like protein (isoleucine patch superfamily)
MKLYVYQTDTVLKPFGDHVSEAQIMLETLAETQARACRKAGLELQRVARPDQAVERPCLLMADYVYVSVKALKDFVRAAGKRRGQGAALALKRGRAVEQTLPLSDARREDWDEGGQGGRVILDLWYLPDGELPGQAAEVRSALASRAPALEVFMREITVPVRLPVLDETRRHFHYAITSTVCCHVQHWVHLLWLCQLAFGVAWLERVYAHKAWAALKLLGSLAQGRSLNRWKVLAGMNDIGPGGDIHPTAYLEASILGKNVKVGAGACIRNSLIGDDVIVADHAVVLNSVVGHRCYLTENFFLVSSLCYPGSTLGNVKLQMAVIGRDVYLHGWCSFLDAKFIGDIKVRHKGEQVGTGQSFLASCVGHRAVLGAKVLIHPGRELPNDLLLVSRPEDVIAEVPADLTPGVPMVRDQGGLVPLASLKKTRS